MVSLGKVQFPLKSRPIPWTRVSIDTCPFRLDPLIHSPRVLLVRVQY